MAAISYIAHFDKCKAFIDEWVNVHPKRALITAIACAALGIASVGIVASIAVTSSAAIVLVSSGILSLTVSACLFISYVQQDPNEPQTYEENESQAYEENESQAYEENRKKLVRVMGQTLQDLKNGYYVCNGAIHLLDMKAAIKGVERVEYPDANPHSGTHHMRVRVLPKDCLDVAQDLCNKGLDPLVLDLANAYTPGGGYKKGCRAQEETVCRRSTLSAAIDQRNRMQPCNFYPLNPTRTSAAGLYVPTVTVFRDKNYQYLDKPFDVSVAVIAAPYKPTLLDKLRLNAEDAQIMRQRIRTTLEMAYLKGHDSVVLGALGCGAFGNPPEHVAEIFHEVINSEYRGCFKEIVFAIFDDHNSGHRHNPEGNFRPFKNRFDPD